MRSWIFAALLLVPSAQLAAQNIGINANGATPNTSAMLDIDVSAIPGTKRGLLIPRMTTVQRNAIVTPATSLLVFNTTTNQFEYFDGAIWRALLSSAAAGWTLTGNTIAATDFIGTLNNQPLVFRVNNQPAGRLEFASLNSFFGTNTGVGNTGTANTFIGGQAGVANTTGSANTYLGAGAGVAASVGSENTAIGFQSSVSNGLSNATALGAYAQATQPNSVVLGSIAGVNAAPASANVGIGTTAPTERLDVVGKARVTNFQMTTGAATGTILMGDVNGNGFWANPTGTAVNAWGLAGNAGTNPLTNYIGTSDNASLRFRTNNILAGFLDHVSSNAFYGTNAGVSTSSGNFNTLIGASAGNATNGGGGNTFVGAGSGASNVTGVENTAIGFSANVNNGLSNATAVGNRAMATQSNSLVLGSISGVNGSFVSTNVGIGTTAPSQRLHVVGSMRMEDGNQAVGRVLTSDVNGVASWQAPAGSGWGLVGNTGTNPATNFVGTTDAQALRFRTANTFAGNISNTATGLVSLGLNAGPANTGLSNTFVGGTAGVVNTTGANNTFLGQGAGAANTTTSSNTYLGTGAGGSNATGQQNVYIGRLAGGNGISGSDNILIGNGAGILNTANNNVMVGSFAGNGNSTGGGNTFMGSSAGSATSTGGQNTFIGTGAGSTNATGTQNTLIGNGAAVNANNLTNATAIGRASRVDVNNGLVLGSVNGINAATSTSLVGIGTTAPLDRLHVVGNIRMVDGNQALGRVLTSDANGTATWQVASGGGVTLDGAYDFGGAGVGRTITADAGAVTIAGADGLLITGTLGSGADPEVVGAGTRMFFNPKKAAFRAGQVNGAQWNTANVGNHSVAMGLNTTASGVGSVALGEAVAATALGSAAIGFSNTASGTDSKAIGSNLIASGPASIALGNDVTTSGTRSAGLGDGLLVRSRSEVALGMNNTDYVPLSTAVFNAADRLLVVGNGAAAATRSDALVILKNGNTGIGSSTPADRLHVVGNIRMVDGNQALGRVMVSNANGTATWTDPLAVATGLAWTLTGNAGTNPATNFVGTTDAQPLRFRTSNQFAGNLPVVASQLVSYGLLAGSNNTGTGNTFVGNSAGLANTTGGSNTFLGNNAGAANLTSGNNTYIGTFAGAANATGQQNVYIGRLAGGSGTSGSDNILIGNGAGVGNTANNNVMVGSFSGNANSTGGGNTFMGTQSGASSTTGGQNTFIGTGAGITNTIGAQNTLIGNGAALNANNLINATAIGRASRVDVNDGLVLGSVNGINAASSTSLVGIGTTAPLDRLHVVGNIRMVDGNQAANRVMVSDANGTATWQTLGAAATNAWGLAGNAGTNPATNFIGTTDAQALRFRTGNAFAGQLGNTGTALVSYGLGAGAAVTALASEVTAIGAGAGAGNTDGDDNTYVGADAGAAMTTSFFSTYVGARAGQFATSSNNALFGFRAGGLGAMTGGLNTFLGSQSGQQNTSGSGNTFVGFSAGSSTTIGGQNVFIGRDAGATAQTVSASVFVGSFAGNMTTVSANTFVGGNAGRLNTTGANNAFFGDNAGNDNLTGNDNTFLGHNSGTLNLASDNTFVGSRSGDSNTSGTRNTFMGTNAGTANITGTDGTFVGSGAGLVNTATGGTFIGSGAGSLNSTGADNTFIGVDGGNTNTTGTNNVVLGNNADVAAAALTNAIAIGADAVVGASNSLVLGATGASAVNVGIGMTTPLTTVDMLGALSIRDDGTVTSVAADNQLVTVGDRGYIRLSSTSIVSTVRTITLSDGLVRGQLLLLECVTTGAFEVDDNAATNNTNVSAARPLGIGDTLMLVWNGTDWTELNYSNN